MKYPTVPGLSGHPVYNRDLVAFQIEIQSDYMRIDF